jgi:hypothetical protein
MNPQRKSARRKLGRSEVARLSWGHEIRGRLHTHPTNNTLLHNTQISYAGASVSQARVMWSRGKNHGVRFVQAND